MMPNFKKFMSKKSNFSSKSLASIHVIGTDASGLNYIPKHLEDLILSANRVAAPKRIIDNFPEWWRTKTQKAKYPELFNTEKIKPLINWLKEEDKLTVIIASGDPLWFGIGRILKECIDSNKIKFYPSPTSLQLAFSRLKIPWQDAKWISLHGRETFFLEKVLKERPKKLAILTDNKNGKPQDIQKIITSMGIEDNYEFWIFERLGNADEKMTKVDKEIPLEVSIDPLNIVVLIKIDSSQVKQKDLPLFGINDNNYFSFNDRPNLITKREVRVQILSDLELPEQGIIWDIGAGTGTIGLEAIRLRPKLKLISVEKRVGGKELITNNSKKLGLKPLSIIEDDITKLLSQNNSILDSNKPDRIVISGLNKKDGDIIINIMSKLEPNGIAVIPVVTLESYADYIKILENLNIKISISQHQSWRGVPLSTGTRFKPINPVFIIKCSL